MYVIRTDPTEAKKPIAWEQVGVAPVQPVPWNGQINATFPYKTAGRYYLVVKNFGRGVEGSPFKIQIDAVKTVAAVTVADQLVFPDKSSSGLFGGLSTVSESAVLLTP